MEKLLAAFKALADPVRLRLFVLLAGGERCVCDLVKATALPQSTVSRHLYHLKTAGLVIDRRQGTWAFYRLQSSDDALTRDLVALVSSRLGDVPQVLDDSARLESFLVSLDRNCGK
jgi:ArsR family transcriptional regulator